MEPTVEKVNILRENLIALYEALNVTMEASVSRAEADGLLRFWNLENKCL